MPTKVNELGDLIPDGPILPRPTHSTLYPGIALEPVDAVVIQRFADRSATFCDHAYDRVGQRFDVFACNSGWDAWFEVYRYDVQGVAVQAWRVDPKPEPATGAHKADGVSLTINRTTTGETVVTVVGTSHYTEAEGRPYFSVIAHIRNSGAIHDMCNPRQGDNLVLNTPPPPPPPPATTCPTAEEIADALDQRFGDGPLRDNLRSLLRQVIAEEGVLRALSGADEKYAILRGNTKDGVYECLTENWPDLFPIREAKPAKARLQGRGGPG